MVGTMSTTRLEPRGSRARPRVAALLTLVALIAGPARPTHAAYHALEEIPVESPIYDMAAQLVASYGSASAFLHTQPWDRADLGRFLDELVANVPSAADDPLVLRLRRELEPAGGVGGWEPALTADDSTASLELSPYGRASFSEDRARHTIVRDFRAGLQGSYAPASGLLLFGDVYAGTQSPGPHGNPANSKHFGIVEGVEVNSYYDRAYATWRGALGRLHIGHSWLHWGPGRWGTMALSDGAPAFDVAEARMTLFRRVEVDWFIASLDPAVESYLAGHRLELRLNPRWDVSFSELARFDGTASVPLYLLPVTPYSLLEKRILKSSDVPSDSLNRLGKNNVMWAMDASWRWRRGVRLWGELAIDDISFSSEKRPRALAWQVGAEARRVRGSHAWTLTGEYARVYQYTYSVFHHHDFEFAGLPTGFPLGPDVDRLNGRLAWQPDPAWTYAVEGVFTRKGEGELGEYYVPGSGAVNNLVLSGVLDVDARGAASVAWSPGPGFQLRVQGGFAHVRDQNHVPGADNSGPYGSARWDVRW